MAIEINNLKDLESVYGDLGNQDKSDIQITIEEPSKNPIGFKVRECRTNENLNIKEAAQKAGMHPTNWGKVENGERSPNIETLRKMLDAIGYDIVFKKR